MELKTAIEILDYHQEWRLGKRETMIHEPKVLTEALDIILEQVKTFTEMGKTPAILCVPCAMYCMGANNKN